VKDKKSNRMPLYALSAIVFFIGFVIGGAIDYSPTSENPWPSYLSIAFTILSGCSGVISLLVILYTFTLWRTQQFEAEEVKSRTIILKQASAAKRTIDLIFTYRRVIHTLPDQGRKARLEQFQDELRNINRELISEKAHCELLQTNKKHFLEQTDKYSNYIAALGIMLVMDTTSNTSLPSTDEFIFELVPEFRKFNGNVLISFDDLKTINVSLYENLINEIREAFK